MLLNPKHFAEKLLHLVHTALLHHAVQSIAGFPKLIHLAQTITTRLAVRHVHHGVTVFLLIMNGRIDTIATSPGRKGVDIPLGDKGNTSADLGVVVV